MPIVVDPGTCDKESEKDWKKENVVDALREGEVRAVPFLVFVNLKERYSDSIIQPDIDKEECPDGKLQRPSFWRLSSASHWLVSSL